MKQTGQPNLTRNEARLTLTDGRTCEVSIRRAFKHIVESDKCFSVQVGGLRITFQAENQAVPWMFRYWLGRHHLFHQFMYPFCRRKPRRGDLYIRNSVKST